MFCALLSLAAPALGADIPDAGRLLRESAPPPIPPAPRKPVIQSPQPAAEEKLPAGIKIRVSGFTITGATAFPVEELQALIAGYAGKELTLAELEEVCRVITSHYRKHGYFLAEAIIPAQTLKLGEPVRIEVLEGRLEGVKVETSPKETRAPRGLLESYVAKLPMGKPVEEGKLTGTAMLVNELPAIKSRVVLEPGDKRGGTKARLEVTEGKPYSITIDSDNYSNYATGYYRSGIGLELYSPFKLGDQLNLRFQSSTSGDLQTMRFGWWVPLNGYGTKLGIDYSFVRYSLGRSFAALDGHGDAHAFSLTLLQPLVRKSNLLMDFTVAGNGCMLDDRIDSAGTSTRRHTAGGQLGINATYVDTIGGSTSLAVYYTGGALEFDDNTARANDQGASGLRTEGVYNKISGSFSRNQSLISNLSLYGGVSGQWSDRNMPSVEQFYLGGPYGVRAYPVGEASADMAVLTTVELRWLQRNLGPLPGQAQLAGLFDHGYARINAKPLASDTSNERTLYGAGFGVSYFLNEMITLKTSVAWRLGELPASDNKDGKKPAVYFQAMVRF